jgi:hypothetical protein
MRNDGFGNHRRDKERLTSPPEKLFCNAASAAAPSKAMNNRQRSIDEALADRAVASAHSPSTFLTHAGN